MKKEEIFRELAKLPTLLRERVPHQAFNMKYMFSQQGRFEGNNKFACYSLSQDPECGTAACVWGWSQVFVKMGLLDFDPIDELKSGEFEFITDCDWSEHPTEHTLEAACARIEYVLKHGEEPLWWEEQMYGHSPVTYRDINNQNQK